MRAYSQEGIAGDTKIKTEAGSGGKTLTVHIKIEQHWRNVMIGKLASQPCHMPRPARPGHRDWAWVGGCLRSSHCRMSMKQSIKGDRNMNRGWHLKMGGSKQKHMGRGNNK